MSKNLYIVPYDFSEVADKAIQYALHIGRHVDTEIKLVHLAKDKPKGMAKVKLLEDVKSKLTIPAGVEITTLVKVGDIFSDIGKIAKKEQAQLIIMGTHGSKGMQWLFGSYAMKILKSADCPFLIIQKNMNTIQKYVNKWDYLLQITILKHLLRERLLILAKSLSN